MHVKSIKWTCPRCGGPKDFKSAQCASCRAAAAPSREAVFWSNVDRSGPIPPHCPELGPCWLWTASRVPTGYGQFYFAGRPRGAHIFAYVTTYGPLPPETPSVLHRCDGAAIACVRPSHLMAGTQPDNIADMVAKGRQQRGERSGKARLTEVQVREIRTRRANGEAVKTLAAEFGVVHSAISNIVSHRKWAHVD